MLKIYLQGQPLSNLHPLLNNQSRLNYLIEKNKRSKFPFGQDIIGCIIADEHQGQALGLGKYLHSKYCHLLSEEHLKHIYKLCQIHFNRNIRNKAISNETKELIYLIIKLNIQEEILHVLEKIKNYNKSGAT
ncbi:7124_t:CDS:2, partial [Gigaspora rosea]